MSQNLCSSVSTLVSNILNKLISPAIEQLSVEFGIEDELNKVKRILQAIQPTLAEAEKRKLRWLSAFKDAVYEIEDVLDDLNYGARRKSISQENKIKKVLYSCFFSNSITSFKLCWRLNIIIRKMEDLAEDIRLSFPINRVPQIPDYSSHQTHSYVDEETVIGREKDKEEIVSSLINYAAASNNEKIMVLPIVAMGGMGKTKLSQLIYMDHRVESHFQLRIWVYVSNAYFDVTRIVRLIIEVATEQFCDFVNMNVLVKQLREIISGKRCLIILDDVWNENLYLWKELKTLLDYCGKGSAVVVSTRSIRAAKIMTTHTIYCLEQLSEEDSWELFRRRAFAKDTEEPASLVKIGKDILKRCDGLPLAIVTIGGMMRHENDEVKWKAVLDSEMWRLDVANDLT
ncbi:putative disease resistance protein RGA3 [Dendrobium catenatum]|nr:putative disease resistance protein RGA3 [Dendrobium catenatum]